MPKQSAYAPQSRILKYLKEVLGTARDDECVVGIQTDTCEADKRGKVGQAGGEQANTFQVFRVRSQPWALRTGKVRGAGLAPRRAAEAQLAESSSL